MKFSILTKAIAGGVALSALLAGAALADPAIIYDGGGKFDASFNEAAYNGAEMYKKETGAGYGELEISSDAQREQFLRQFAERGYSPIITPGYNFVTALESVAPEFPDTHFVILDAVVDLPNVRSVLFKEHEGSYLAGIMAAMKSESGKIGVVPAFNLDLLEAFACGYKQGAKSVNGDIEVLETYIGSGFDAFNDKPKAVEVAKSQLDQGVDVVYQVAGGAGAGVLQAAADAGKFSIGVDSNQNHLYPGSVLTSMVKRVDVATYNAMMDEKNGNWSGGTIVLGLAEDGVGVAFDENNASIVTDDMKAAVEKARQDIISGAVEVHDYRTDQSCPA
ncbi:BMP family ABC transporter substrate-binding protein [Devosia sp. PTR5]|uniref:BMP family ABC transporter substrate-binding protein n=1 Tax=Devosia oryzisoli TaxID=2774138 RepID=A0A927FTI2_9HYPH|nr:BMP family ABC transporter substrate-binding protein [Devosia oryzisoli]MBD8065726.1 BMP family ABC transporter substrate-binding protein [Devosia oryzisoli]